MDAGSGDDHTATWDFGDGTTVTPTVENGAVSGTHNYADNGEYTVTLTIVDDDGARDEKTLLVSITNVNPTAEAGADRIVDEGASVEFAGSHTDPGSADTHTYVWDFGDNTAVVDGTPVQHTYADNGTYPVRLTVTDDDGGSGTDALTVTVNNVAPVITYLYSNAPKSEGAEVGFTAHYRDAGSGDEHTVTWDFGDGAVFSEKAVGGRVTINHIYSDNGVYTVTVTITDDDGASVSQITEVEIVNAPPVASAGPDQTTDEGVTVRFAGGHTDPGSDDTHTYTWDFGDGSTGTGKNTEHVYADNDEYIVTLWVTDDDGGVGSDTLTVTVNNTPPVIKTLESNAPQPEGTAVGFTEEYTDAGSGDTHTATWDYGDGTKEPAVLANGTVLGSHAYGDNGLYTVTVTVTDDDGGEAVQTLTISITNVDPTAEAGENQTASEGFEVMFAGHHTDPGSDDTHTYAWDFGDGATGEGTDVQHAYGDNGVYTVTLTVTDDDGGVGTDTLTVAVDNVAPVIDAGEDHTLDENTTLSLTAGFSDSGWLDTHSTTWDFGDGSSLVQGTTTETREAPHAVGNAVGAHTYEWPGVYTVTMTDDDGAATHDTLTVVVQDAAPPNAILASPSPDNVGLCKLVNATVQIWGIINDIHDSETHAAVQTPDNMGWYQLRYAPGQEAQDGWQDLTEPKPTASFTEEQLIADWDTSSLATGYYTLQLIASEKTDTLTHPNVTTVTAVIYIGAPEHLFSFGDEEITSGKKDHRGKSHGRHGDDDDEDDDADDDRRGRRGDDDDDDEDEDDDRDEHRRKTVLDWPGYVTVVGPEDGGIVRIPIGRGDGDDDDDDDDEDDDDDRGRKRQLFQSVDVPAGQYLIGVTESQRRQVTFFLSGGTDAGTKPVYSLKIGEGDDDDEDDEDGRGRQPDAYDLALRLVEDPDTVGTYDLEVYLAVRNGNKVLRIDKEGTTKLGFELIQKHGRKGRSKPKKIKFRKPTGIDLDEAGHIYVTDTGNNRVVVLYPDGELEREIKEDFRAPTGIQVVEVLDDEGYIVGDVIYVADTDNHRIVKITGNDEIDSVIGGFGSEPGQLDTPLDVHVNSRGYLFVTEAGNHRVQKFDRFGKSVMQFVGFEAPVGLVLDPTGEILYVTDTREDRVEAYGLPAP